MGRAACEAYLPVRATAGHADHPLRAGKASAASTVTAASGQLDAGCMDVGLEFGRSASHGAQEQEHFASLKGSAS